MGDKPLVLYQAVMPEDYQEILALLIGPFTNQEPLNQSVLTQGKCTRQRSNEAKEHHSKVALTSEYSVTAKHNGHVVGVMVSTLTSTEKYETPNEAYIPEIGTLLSRLYKQRAENFPFRQFVLVHICVVGAEYQQMGISKHMLEWTIQMVRANKVPGIVAEASSIYSQRSFAKFGFKSISEITYSQYEDEKGNVVFPDTGEHKSIKLVYLKV